MRIEIDSNNGVEGKWAKAGKDIKDGDRLKLLTAGQITESGFKDDDGTPKQQYVFKILTKEREEFNVAFNRTSRNTLARGFGQESEDWVGKVVTCFVVKQMVGDGLKNVLYLAPDGWIMTEDGEFVGEDEMKAPQGKQVAITKVKPAYPEMTVENDAHDAIHSEDSPF